MRARVRLPFHSSSLVFIHRPTESTFEIQQKHSDQAPRCPLHHLELSRRRNWKRKKEREEGGEEERESSLDYSMERSLTSSPNFETLLRPQLRLLRQIITGTLVMNNYFYMISSFICYFSPFFPLVFSFVSLLCVTACVRKFGIRD